MWSQTHNRQSCGATAAALILLPFVISTPLATGILVWSIFALGFNLLLGYTGVLSFGHAAYFGLGAYTGRSHTSLLARGSLDQPRYGHRGSHAPGVLYRPRCDTPPRCLFAMISLAFGQMLYFLALSPLKDITRGEDGLTHIPSVNLFFISLEKPLNLYYFILAITVLMLYMTWRILQSPFGRLLQAFRENEERAKACGYNTTLVKFFSLVLSACYGGLAGSLNTLYLGYVPLTTSSGSLRGPSS